MLMLAVSACGQAQTSSSKQKDGEGKSKSTIRVVTTAGGYPFGVVNPKNNEYEGFMYEIINELGKRVDMNVEMKTADWSALIPSLQSGKADVIVDGMYITDERKKVINFTEPVFGYGEGLIVQEGDKSIKSLEDLDGKTVGVQIGTSFKEMVEEKTKGIKVEIKTYQTQADILKDIENKRLDAALADGPSFTYIKSKNPNMKFQVINEYKPSLFGKIGIGVALDNKELVEKLNPAIEEMKQDGSLKAIYKKWGVDWDFN